MKKDVVIILEGKYQRIKREMRKENDYFTRKELNIIYKNKVTDDYTKRNKHHHIEKLSL